MKQFLAFTVFATATLGLFSQQSAAQAGNLITGQKAILSMCTILALERLPQKR
jgi:hypothetical protein